MTVSLQRTAIVLATLVAVVVLGVTGTVEDVTPWVTGLVGLSIPATVTKD